MPCLYNDVDDVIPTPREIEEEFPLSLDQINFITRSRKTVEAILNGLDQRIFLIVGPCSIHDPDAAKEYAMRFRELSAAVSEQFFLIMRTYFEKPRTSLGWKGLFYDPDLDGTYNVAKGVRLTRKLLHELTEMEIPLASELLEITTSHYYSNFLTWGCIGARTSSSPPHRQLASTLHFPVGFKNSCDGNVDNSIRGVIAASSPHVFLGISPEGFLSRTRGSGNPNGHIVLRGGESGPNYDAKNVQLAIEKCARSKINKRVVIDCSHDNCEKNYTKQIFVFQSVMNQILEGNRNIVGIMLESNLGAGSQTISRSLHYGVSITDPCLDWSTTERLIREACSRLQSPALCLV